MYYNLTSDCGPFSMICRHRENIIIPNNLGPVKIKTNEEKMVESVLDSCFFKSFMACVLGMFLFSLALFSGKLDSLFCMKNF